MNVKSQPHPEPVLDHHSHPDDATQPSLKEESSGTQHDVAFFIMPYCVSSVERREDGRVHGDALQSGQDVSLEMWR